MVVSASGELRKIQEYCNYVDKLQAHTVLAICDIRYNCYVRFSDSHMGLEGFVSFLGMGARIFREIWASWTFIHIWGPRSNSNW